MNHVRDKDIDIYLRGGIDWVRAATGGISTFDTLGTSGQTWWRLGTGYDYGAHLLIWNDHGGHWLWEPVRDMRLSEFKSELARSHSFFTRV